VWLLGLASTLNSSSGTGRTRKGFIWLTKGYLNGAEREQTSVCCCSMRHAYRTGAELGRSPNREQLGAYLWIVVYYLPYNPSLCLGLLEANMNELLFFKATTILKAMVPGFWRFDCSETIL
jgi:hypothetical protein